MTHEKTEVQTRERTYPLSQLVRRHLLGEMGTHTI